MVSMKNSEARSVKAAKVERQRSSSGSSCSSGGARSGDCESCRTKKAHEHNTEAVSGQGNANLLSTTGVTRKISSLSIAITREKVISSIFAPISVFNRRRGRTQAEKRAHKAFSYFLPAFDIQRPPSPSSRLSPSLPKLSEQLLHSAFLVNARPKYSSYHKLIPFISALIRTEEEDRADLLVEHVVFKVLRKTITFIVGCFAILWSPYYILATVYGFCKGECIPTLLYTLSYYMCYLNSSCNPFAYAMANRQFRLAFVRILKGDFNKSV